MNIFQTLQPKDFTAELVQALLVHRCETDNIYGSPTYVITSHCVHQQPEGPIIGEGRVFDSHAQSSLVSVLLDSLKVTGGGYLPREVIASTASELAWIVPGRVRKMWFRSQQRTISLQVPWPTLLLHASQARLAVVALASTRRPGPRTALYHAPLMNVYDNTRLCHGTAALPRTWALADRRGYEDGIFLTNFSHTNHHHTLKLGASKHEVSNQQHLRFWRELHNAKAAHFPRAALVPLRRTVEQWINALARQS